MAAYLQRNPFVRSSDMSIESAETQAKSYRYLRIAMIGLLLALAAAVFYQSSQQDSFLASVSAYYYTPAQAIFVGALIGLGASMIALQGMNDAEDVFLNLGGMFAIVVAIVPTGRGADFNSAVRACRASGGTLLTHQASTNLDCPGVLALQDATRANVERTTWPRCSSWVAWPSSSPRSSCSKSGRPSAETQDGGGHLGDSLRQCWCGWAD
jgi:hypothetical protein